MNEINFLESNSFIKYVPELNLKFKNVESTLLMGQLEYWFSKYVNGFYKFMEPCDHSHYRKGDSWTEELSLSRKVFNKAFALIGVRYKSKSAYDSEIDKFKGKLYASYYDRGQNKTYYFRNHLLLKDFFSDKKLKSKKPFSRIDKKEEPFRNGQSGRSSIYKEITKNINKSPSLSPSNLFFQGKKIEMENESMKKERERDDYKSGPFLSSEEFETAQTMRNIWIEATKNKIFTPKLSIKMVIKLLQSLKNFFSGELKLWKAYCFKIGSSAFLMGEKEGGFNLWLVRAIQKDMIDKINEGKYGVDFSNNFNSEEEAIKEKNLMKVHQIKVETTSSTEIEKKIRLFLLNKHGSLVYESWFKDLSIHYFDSETVNFYFKTPFRAYYVQQKFRQTFETIKQNFNLKTLTFKIQPL